MPEILRSGAEWQHLRCLRRKREAWEAARANTAPLNGDSTVYTFVPGGAAPLVGIVDSNGRVQTLKRPATTAQTHTPPIKRRPPPVVTTNSILASRARDDEILLARLRAPREHGLKRKSTADVAGPSKCVKKRKNTSPANIL
ncbi:hypothetical protein B0H11DRAFT_2264647 [Mycena galericulata]|nr:hypothetical protein B0H11DRAFT_2264647 [Mycena galericulata]